MGAALCPAAGVVEGRLADALVALDVSAQAHRAGRRVPRPALTVHDSAPTPVLPSAACMLGAVNVRPFHRSSAAGGNRAQQPTASVAFPAGSGECAAPPPPMPCAGAVDRSWALVNGAAGLVCGLPALGGLRELVRPGWLGALMPGAQRCNSGHAAGSAAPLQRRLGGGQRLTASSGSKQPRAQRGGAGAPPHAPRVLCASRTGQWSVISSPVACAHGRVPSGRTRGAHVCRCIDELGEGEMGVTVGCR
jgi:hypothetical protein